MLMKLTPGFNFINILCALFLPIFWRQKIPNPKHSFVFFGAKISYKKRASKTLMKLMVDKEINARQR